MSNAAPSAPPVQEPIHRERLPSNATETKWPIRRTFFFVVATCLILWSTILLAIWLFI